MIHELRVYTPEPGMLEALLHRFRVYTLDLFDRHGLEVDGYWVERGPVPRFCYLVRHSSRAAADVTWDRIRADPVSPPPVSGPLLAAKTSTFLAPTAFSPLR